MPEIGNSSEDVAKYPKIGDLAKFKTRTVIPPETGWKEHTYYQVEVAWSSSNPVHQAILGVGFLGANSPDGQPGNYSEIWNHSYDCACDFRTAWYVRVVK